MAPILSWKLVIHRKTIRKSDAHQLITRMNFRVIHKGLFLCERVIAAESCIRSLGSDDIHTQ